MRPSAWEPRLRGTFEAGATLETRLRTDLDHARGEPMSIKTERSPFFDEDTFLAYPTHHVFGVVDSRPQVDAILEGLYALGYAEHAVNAATGKDAVEGVDLEGERSGLRGRIVRAVQHLGGEYEAMQNYVAALEAGRYVVTAPADDDEDREAVVALFAEHGAEQLAHFKPAVVEYL
jgi:hypothetical protein